MGARLLMFLCTERTYTVNLAREVHFQIRCTQDRKYKGSALELDHKKD